MFKCAFCKKVSEPGEKLHKIVTKTRNARYPLREHYKNGQRVIDDYGGIGKEIAEEKNACTDCAKVQSSLIPVNR